MESNKAGLKVVYDRSRSRIRTEDFFEQPVQSTLFPTPHKRLLICVSFSAISDTEFTQLLDSVRPGLVVELRSVPRFDLGQMNRRLVFQLFRAYSTTYVDLAASGYLPERWAEAANELRRAIDATIGRGDRPIMFLLSRADCFDSLVNDLASVLPPSPDEPWRFYQVPLEA